MIIIGSSEYIFIAGKVILIPNKPTDKSQEISFPGFQELAKFVRTTTLVLDIIWLKLIKGFYVAHQKA